MESNCCSSPPTTELDGNSGYCSECKDHAVFTEEEENGSK